MEEEEMRRVQIKDGYVKIPNDWIVVSGVFAPDRECPFAYAVTCRDAYGLYDDAPKFVAFGELPAEELTAEMQDKIYAACAQKSERAAELMSIWTDVESSFADPLKLTEEERDRWDRAPVFGIFQIVQDGNLVYGKRPYGAVVVKSE